MNSSENVQIPYEYFREMVNDSAELYALRTHLKILMTSDDSGILYKKDVAEICCIGLSEVNE